MILTNLRRFKAILFMAMAGLVFLLPSAQAGINDFQITSELKVEVVDGANLNIEYIIHNWTQNIIAPTSQAITYSITPVYPNLYTKNINISGSLDTAFQANVSQYAVPGGSAVFGVKQIPIPPLMKSFPGFYRIYVNQQLPNVIADDVVFYVPKCVQTNTCQPTQRPFYF